MFIPSTVALATHANINTVFLVPDMLHHHIPKKILSLRSPKYISNSTVSIILTDICSAWHDPDLSNHSISAERSDSTLHLLNLFSTCQPAVVFIKQKSKHTISVITIREIFKLFTFPIRSWTHYLLAHLILLLSLFTGLWSLWPFYDSGILGLTNLSYYFRSVKFIPSLLIIIVSISFCIFGKTCNCTHQFLLYLNYTCIYAYLSIYIKYYLKSLECFH